MNVVVVESTGQSQNHQQVSRQRLHRPGELRPCPRPALQGRLGAPGRRFFDCRWEVDDRGEKRMKEIVRALKGADHLFLATDPDREGEAISWHVNEELLRRHALKGVDVKRVVFNEGDQETRCSRRSATPGRSTASWSRPTWRVGPSTISSAFTLSPVLWRKLPGQQVGRPRAVGGAPPDLRARGRDRGLQAARILVDRGRLPHARRPGIHRPPHPSRR